KAMKHIVGIAVPSHDVTVRADRGSPGKGSARVIEGVELAPAQQIAMGYAVERIAPNHLPTGIDRGHVREGGAGHVDRSVVAIVQQKPVALDAGRVASHDIVAPNPDGYGHAGAGGIVNGLELATGAEWVGVHHKGVKEIVRE